MCKLDYFESVKSVLKEIGIFSITYFYYDVSITKLNNVDSGNDVDNDDEDDVNDDDGGINHKTSSSYSSTSSSLYEFNQSKQDIGNN